MSGYQVYVISAGRPGNVPAMTARFAPDTLTWVVPADERYDYKQAGADLVIGVRTPPPPRYALVAARNTALRHATGNGLVCIQTDDDCKGFKHIGATPAVKPFPLAWTYVRQTLLEALDGTVHLAGVPPTDNAYFAHGKTLRYGFIIGSLCATDTAIPTWDESLPFKEDYDYTCAHLELYGAVARLDMITASYQHYSNRGGAVTNRTPEAEQALCAELLRRWPGYLRPHARRPAELAFRPAPRTAVNR
jgi:hypothetical protein